jgi:hypothetical protein
MEVKIIRRKKCQITDGSGKVEGGIGVRMAAVSFRIGIGLQRIILG